MSIRKGPNIRSMFSLLDTALTFFEKMKFAHNERLGYLTFCPTSLGSTIRALVHIQLPKLGMNVKRLKALASQHNVQIRGVAGENSALAGSVVDVSNVRRLGINEVEAVVQMLAGVEALVAYEEAESDSN